MQRCVRSSGRDRSPGDSLTQTTTNCFFDLPSLDDFSRLEMCSKARCSDSLVAAILNTRVGG
jgi:chromosome segregation and condensation protein ScpB